MPTGNGAYIVHRWLEDALDNYRVRGYNPYWTLLPPLLYLTGRSMLRTADVIHTTPDYGLFFEHGDTPMVLTLHNYMLDAYMRQYSSTLQKIHYATDLRWFTERSLSRASIVTAVSHFTARLAREHGGYEDDIRVITNGVDTDRFQPRRRHPAETGPLRVLFVGNLTRRKGADLLPAIAGLVNDNVIIQYTCGLRTRRGLPDSARLQRAGAVAYEDMPELYRSADVLLFPTVREGFPLAVVEAMASGLAIVASDCSSLPELVDEGRGGYLCPPGDAAAFAERLNRLSKAREVCADMGGYNREKAVDSYRFADMVEAYRRTFEESLDRTRG